MTHKIILATILILSGNQIFSQDSIKGRTIDYETNQTLPFVTITNSNNRYYGTYSDRDGNFKIAVKSNKINFELNFAFYYPIKFINIPKGDKNIDFKEIRLVPNHLWDNRAIGPLTPLYIDNFQKKQEQDNQLRMNVLHNYRIKIKGKKLKPYFEGPRPETEYMVFDFDKQGKE